jgi:hypothetical protein
MDIFLKAGQHHSLEEGGCVMEFASWLAGEPHSDTPSCVDGTIRAAAIWVNDSSNDVDRQLLVPLAIDAIGTACHWDPRRFPDEPIAEGERIAMQRAGMWHEFRSLRNAAASRVKTRDTDVLCRINVPSPGFPVGWSSQVAVYCDYSWVAKGREVLKDMIALGRKEDVDMVEERLQEYRQACLV